MRRVGATVLVGQLLVGCAAQSPCPFPAAPQALVSGGAGEQLHGFLRDSLPGQFSGVVIVERQGETLLHGAYGFDDARECTPSDTAHAYWLGSLSKQFAAVAALRLADDGELDLERRLSDYLVAVPADKMDVRVHQLLSHSSGLPNRYSADGVADRAQAIRTILGQGLERVPGEAYGYSNDAYSLVAALVEEVSGRSYEAFVNEALIGPLGLREIGLAADSGRWNRLDVAARAWGAPRDGSPQFWEPDWGYKGATGVMASATDLRAWFVAVREGRVITPARVESLFAAHTPTRVAGLSYGYGWYRLDREPGHVVVLHNGDDDFIGHSASLRWIEPDAVLVIVLSNSGYWEDQAVASVVGAELEARVLDATR